MSSLVDLTGRQFAAWTVLRYASKGKWHVRCRCGGEYVVEGGKLKIGKSKCCRKCRGRTHGMSKGNLTYQSWKHMRRRCLRPNNDDYLHYGGRGIEICKRWDSFANFLADMGEKPAKLTLERKDVNGNYCPSNCCWATQKEQCRNQRRNRAITYKGRTQSLAAWCEELKLRYYTVHVRLRRGWSINAALDARTFTSWFDRAKRLGDPLTR